jgi:hypothetical protein
MVCSRMLHRVVLPAGGNARRLSSSPFGLRIGSTKLWSKPLRLRQGRRVCSVVAGDAKSFSHQVTFLPLVDCLPAVLLFLVFVAVRV